MKPPPVLVPVVVGMVIAVINRTFNQRLATATVKALELLRAEEGRVKKAHDDMLQSFNTRVEGVDTANPSSR